MVGATRALASLAASAMASTRRSVGNTWARSATCFGRSASTSADGRPPSDRASSSTTPSSALNGTVSRS
jgi:hypothetical protein